MNITVQVSGITSSLYLTPYISFTSGDVIHRATSHTGHVSSSLSQGTQSFTLRLRDVTEDAVWVFGIDITADTIMVSQASTR